MKKETAERLDIEDFHYEHSNVLSKPVYHQHDAYEIYYMHEGENMYFIEDKSFRLKANDIIFIDKNVIHKPNYLTKNYERSFFYISDGFLNADMKKAIKQLCLTRVYTPENSVYIQNLITNIQNEITSSDCIRNTLIKSYLTEFIAYCLRHKSIYVKDASQNPTIERLVKHINSFYNQNITLGESARNLKMNESYLSRLFKSSTGFAFSEYLTVIRIKHAKDLLVNSQESIKQIASECGFNDSNYFSKVFKDETGISPLKYRHSHILDKTNYTEKPAL